MNRPKSNLGRNETAYNCGSCDRPDHDDSQMVFCDNCERWYHFTCQQVTSDVKDDDTWVCVDCSASGGHRNPTANTDPVDEELAETDKALARERELFQKQMEKRMELAKKKLMLENEKREMEWAVEKQEMEMRIAAEEQFNRKRQMEIDWMQRKLDSVMNERSEIEGRLKKKINKTNSKLVEKNLRRTDATSSEFVIGKPSSSTPLEDNEMVNSGKITISKQKHKEVYRETPRRNPSILTEKDKSRNAKGKKVVVQMSGSDEDLRSECTVHDCDSESSVEENAQIDINTEANSEFSDSEEEKTCSNKKLNTKMKMLEITPTKAQLSARQFLSKRLPTFSGKPEEWVMFITTYQTTTKACGFSNLENLARLQECLKGPALEAVYTRLLLPSSVPRIIDDLREQFGQPEQVLDILMAKIRSADVPKVDKPASFISFGRLIQQLCDHLEATDLEDHLINPMLIRELAKKLPASTKLDWIRFKRNECCKKRKITLSTFAEFLSEIVSVATEAVNLIDGPTNSNTFERTRKNAGKEREGYLHAHSASENDGSQLLHTQNRTPCLMCGEINHRLRNCQEFLKLSVYQRLQAVDGWGLCMICLNAHGNARCRMNIRCRVENCQERHNTLLHQQEVQSNCNTHSIQFQQSIIFRMIPVVLSHGDTSVRTLAFLDEGSSYTLVESSITKQLHCSGVTQPLRVTWTAGMTRLERHSQKLDLSISSEDSVEKFSIRNAHTVEKLQLPVQNLRFGDIIQHYKHLEGLPVANYPKEPPRILIGLKDLHLFAPLESRVGNPGEPIAVRSRLGWTIYGPLESVQSQANIVGHHSCAELSNQELHDLLKSHYMLEESEIGVAVIPESNDDRRAREILERTTIRLGERYQTGLLWKEDVIEFPDSYPMAIRRMKGLQLRLAKNKNLLDNVQQQIVEYQLKGYCHKATKKELNESDPKRVWYLPLNIVLNPKKPGKVRLVWDAAATVDGVSLNSKLLKGPDYLTSLPSVICQFREHLIGFGGDIREMFHQVNIRPEDRQAQRFIFGGQIYVMDCAIFGATCSPSQALYVKDTNAKEFASIYPEASIAVIRKHYVDDYYDSVTTVAEAVKRAKEVREIHLKAGYEIRNWVSNSSEVLRQLGEPKVNHLIHFNRDKDSGFERVLGIVWNTQEDVFTFSMQMRSDLQPFLVEGKHPSKRVVLSCVMSLFDPLGLLALFTIHGRILIQDLWRNGCDWDGPIDDESMQKWKRWTSCLTIVESMKVPRYYFGNGLALDYDSLQLHIFVDASENAYGGVGYFRILSSGVPRCSLVQARSKVAPLKRQSIPRLELMAAVIGARMKDTILENHEISIKRVIFWTDSRTALSWIKSDHRKYKQFVAHRIGEILNRTKMTEWRWIPTRMNVADELTKWSKRPLLSSDGPWLTGPGFLYQPEDKWPEQQEVEPNVVEELRAVFLYHDIHVPQPLIDVTRISKWNVLVRTVACVLRFISNIRRKTEKKPIETLPPLSKFQYSLRIASVKQSLRREEFQEAERLLFKIAQNDAFPDEVRILRRLRERNDHNKTVIEKGSILYRLSPIIDEFNVIRIDGRIGKVEFVPFELRFPIILPKQHSVTIRLLEYYHQKFGHANRETIVNEIRQRFYIPNIRAELKKVMRQCIWCKVHKCKPIVPRMAPLPIQRTTPHLRSFSFVGVDFFGPILVTVGRRSEKRWVSLFTCFTTRAIHLEIAYSLSTQSCLMAIRRFICRRGTPIEFFSDNGTNFVGASKEIVKKIETDCSENLTNARTRWNFNPPSAPHMGGVWERLVRSVKEALKVLNDGVTINDELLSTSLAEAEDMINTRPLTYLPQESSDVEALTPNHFIRGYPSSGFETYPKPTEEASALRDVYKRSQLLADRLWRRWIHEYLPTINLRSKWHDERDPIEKNEIVYIADDLNRRHWVRGVVNDIVKGTDGRIRQVTVLAGGKLYKRPVSKIAVPEIRDGKSDSEEHPPELRGGAVEAPAGNQI